MEIDLGGGLTFRVAGRIDRIDRVGPAQFEVLDYKTGGFWRDDWQGIFSGGRRLQHALYGLAAVELLRAKYRNPKVTGPPAQSGSTNSAVVSGTDSSQPKDSASLAIPP
ncbi:MAG: PD-(D/E)XK nuclease family protein [Acidobacteria bacterium]|nr:PD-(D/E)XK nuclease family protein [Acidobacteriota bacterium]